MTPAELTAIIQKLGVSRAELARIVGAASDRTIRGWEHGARNGRPAPIPRSVEIILDLVIHVPAARKRLGISN